MLVDINQAHEFGIFQRRSFSFLLPRSFLTNNNLCHFYYNPLFVSGLGTLHIFTFRFTKSSSGGFVSLWFHGETYRYMRCAQKDTLLIKRIRDMSAKRPAWYAFSLNQQRTREKSGEKGRIIICEFYYFGICTSAWANSRKFHLFEKERTKASEEERKTTKNWFVIKVKEE